MPVLRHNGLDFNIRGVLSYHEGAPIRATIHGSDGVTVTYTDGSSEFISIEDWQSRYINRSGKESSMDLRIHFDVVGEPRAYIELSPKMISAWITRIRGDYFNNLTRGEAFGRIVSEMYDKMDAEDYNWDDLDGMGISRSALSTQVHALASRMLDTADREWDLSPLEED